MNTKSLIQSALSIVALACIAMTANAAEPSSRGPGGPGGPSHGQPGPGGPGGHGGQPQPFPQPQPMPQPMPQPSQSSGDRLRSVNDTLYTNQSIVSNSGQFMLVMQGDCNLVVYQSSGYGSIPRWSSKTTNRGYNCRAVMQSDGNFVVYDGQNRALFNTRTVYNGGDYLVVQDDGNLVVYSAYNRALWASGSN